MICIIINFSGQWLCSPCRGGVNPVCALCPNLGGAMKSTQSGHKWAHVSCVLWIPEVSIGCAEKMEPITKISSIPASRWSLICVLCRDRNGACIQCSVKSCKTAYHVTCAFKHNLEMRAIIEDENADDGVKLRSYCQKHSMNSKKDKCAGSGSEEEESRRKRRKDMTTEEKSQARAIRLHEIEAEFDRHVSIKDISTHLLDVDQDGIQYMYNYWKLKRKAGHNRPLLPPKTDESDMLMHRQEQADIDKKKMFVQLRQDLERVRNLCYMVSRREKLSRSFFRMREQTFQKQVAVLSGEHTLTPAVTNAVVEANHGPSIYDRLYSHPSATDHKNDFENILAQIAGLDSEDDIKKDLNGLIRRNKPENPYRRLYFNGSARRSTSVGDYSGLSSGAESLPDREVRPRNKYRMPIYSSTDEDETPPLIPPTKKKALSKEKDTDDNRKIVDKKKPRTSISRSKICTSSEDEKNVVKCNWIRASNLFTLPSIGREMRAQSNSASESDDLISIRPIKKFKLSDIIYSDSECSESNKNEDNNEDKSSNATSDSQQQPFRTKAAVKEFIPIPKGFNKNTRQIKKYKANASDEDVKNKENMKTSKNKDYPSDLIVPQRQAAKKASENMRSTTTNTKNKDSSDNNDSKPAPIVDDAKMKFKQKLKDKKKENKEIPKDTITKKEMKTSSYSDLFDFEKESEKDNQDILAYVPQRQAAKKAAEHIKSGMSKVPEGSTEDANKKKEPIIETSKKSPKKDDKKAKSNKSTSSSSSSSSSSSCSSSSSEYDEETDKTTPKTILETRRSNNSRSLFSPPRRMSADLPFLDEGTKVISSSSPSSDSEAKGSPVKHHSNKVSPSRTHQKKSNSPVSENTKTTSGVSRKTSDKKSKIADGLSESGRSRPITEGEKSAGTNSTSSRASTRTRARGFVAGSGNISDRKSSGQRKSIKEETVSASKDSKENRESSKLPFAQWKTHKKLKYSNDHTSENNSESKKITKDFDNTLLSKSSTNDSTSEIKSESKLSEKTEEKKNTKSDQVSIEDKKEKALSKEVSQKHAKIDQIRRDGFDTVKISENQSKDNDKNLRKASGQILRGSNIVKSPKTPLQVDHNLSEPCEGQTPRLHEPKDKTKSKLIIPDSIEKATGETFPDCDAIQDTDNHKAKSVVPPPAYPNRSIFSPPAFKDTGAELFDFEKELLAVDENVNDEGFNITQVNDEMMKSAPLTFSFGSEFFFKEEVKEDRGVKETLNLVEKLRMKMESKKSGTANTQGEQNESEIEGKENENNLTSFSECSPYKKSEIGDESKDFEKCDVLPIDKVLDKNSISLSQTLQETPYEIVDKPETSQTDSNDNEPDRCDVKKEEKSWTSTNKAISDQNSNNSQSEKIITYNLTNECIDNTLNDSKSLPNNILDKPQPVELSEKERFLSHPSVDKNFENNVDNNICNESPQIEAPSIKHKSITNRTSEMQESFQPFENENVIQPPECTPIPSPYNSNKQQTKWSESELMPVRRSSTSSSASDGSSVSHKQDDIENSKPNNNIPPQVLNPMLQNMEFNNMPQYHPCSIDPLDYSHFSSEATQFLGEPTPLFPPATINSKLPLPTSANPMFHSNLNLPYQLPKLNVEPINFPAPCSAAFTTSSHNIALTTAMIAPLTPKPVSEYSSNHNGEPDLTSPHQFVMHESPLTPMEEFSNSSIVQSQVDKSQTSVPSISPIQDKKSPSKPTRTSSRFVPHQIKSPCKSPGKSPKQIDSTKGGVNRRGINRNARGSRNRGRPRGKTTQNIHTYPHIDMDYYGIHNKLAGTVYDLDFDEDIANNSVSDLKSMRERRRSTDVHDRKSESSYRDSSQSPKFTSPSQHSNKRSFTADIKELRPPTPIQELPAAAEPPRSPAAALNVPVAAVPQFTNIVQPVLPGPVDMRTYSTFEPSNTDAFNNHLLGAFASGTADQQLAEIDEESEKELHYALIASSNKSQESFETSSVPIKNIEKNIEEPAQCYDLSTPKVSLTDPRNQLKVKIKGPFLDANYSASCVTPAIQQPSLPVMEQPSGMQILGTPSAVGSATSAMLSGTSNLRRMRKKELLRQYCTQDMNMDDPMSGTSNNQVSIPAPVTSFSRNVITIPKAVASMTSIPTREDYKAVVDANMEKKRRKISGGLSRELRHLDCSQNDLDTQDNLNKAFTPSQLALSYKRRGRVPKPTTNSVSVMPSAPKLKIKFGSCVTSEQTASTEDPAFDSQFKPPKKRLMSMPRPSVEDLKRESMKYRRKVMADFEEGEKEKKKRIKSEKRKKKKEKWGSEMRVIDKQLESSTKLIIRLSRKKGENSNTNLSGDEGTSGQFSDQPAEYVPNPPLPSEDPYDYDPTAPDPLAIDSPAPTENSLFASGGAKVNSSKVSPIRLKLSRDRDGPNYVMKDCPGAVTEESSNIDLVGPSNSDPLSCPSIPHNKHCEVR